LDRSGVEERRRVMADLVIKSSRAHAEAAGARVRAAMREAWWNVTDALGRALARLAGAMELGAFEVRTFDRTRKDSID
jgi:hypothetical protein